MKNSELVAQLLKLPADAEAAIVFDGAVRVELDAVWLTRSGQIAVASAREYVTDDSDRTAEAPDRSVVRHLDIHAMLGLPEPKSDFD